MKGKQIAKTSQETLLKAIDESGTSISMCCEILMLNERRYYRWKIWKEPKKRIAWNKLKPDEEAAILEAARDEGLSDQRAAGLMVYGHENGKYYCSPSTVQKTLKKYELTVPYVTPKRKTLKKPEIRKLITGPNKIYCYDGTEFFLTSGLRVIAVPILDIGSRKNLKNGVYVRSFTEQNVKKLWDETLFEEGVDTAGLTILSDNGGQMKGSIVRKHMKDNWQVTLVYARPHTPNDNPWIEAFNKSLHWHPSKPETFETTQDVINWVELHKTLHNDHPHSALGYVRPNDEHAGLGNGIRHQRKENLKIARQERLRYYYESQTRDQESGEWLEVVHNSSAVC